MKLHTKKSCDTISFEDDNSHFYFMIIVMNFHVVVMMTAFAEKKPKMKCGNSWCKHEAL